MVSRLQKYGAGQALVLDKTLLEMLHIDSDTPLQVEVSGGSLVVTPILAEADREKTAAPQEKNVSVADNPPYPPSLMQEYHALTDKKLHRVLTPKETARLGEARRQIAAIDEQRSRPDTWDDQARKLREELARIRAEVEALPDTTPNHR